MLPFGHCGLNPFEMARSHMKHFIKTHNTKFTLTDMEQLTEGEGHRTNSGRSTDCRGYS